MAQKHATARRPIGSAAVKFFLEEHNHGIRPHSPRNQKRTDLYIGGAMVLSMLMLTLTGYGLYYVAGENNRPVWSVAH